MAPTGQELLADLTPAQQEAVAHFEGPLLILAAAGSGKTRVITRRVAWLLQQGVRASNILAITFTNKAATEMRERVEKLAPGNRVMIRTFHSLGATLLRQYADRLAIDRNFTIYDTDDRNRIVKNALEASGMDNAKFTPESIGAAISKAKNQLLTPEEFARGNSDYFGKVVAKIYGMYQKKLRESNAMDFDDLLFQPAMALRHNPELRADLDSRFRFVLIDEYQDTNLAQYEIAHHLSIDQRNLCVVGDPDQCLIPGTMIATSSGIRPIEDIQDGDYVLACTGRGQIESVLCDKVMSKPHQGDLVVIRLVGGAEIHATSNHVCFARMSDRAKNIRRPLFIVRHNEADAARFHNWPHLPLPDGERYSGYLVSAPESEPDPILHLHRRASYSCIRAGNVQEGMIFPTLENGLVTEREVHSVERKMYEGLVYDLSVPKVHNYVANGIVVHNSIYRWRGSDIRNILDFEKHYPDARVVMLGNNFRSTKAILNAAGHLIEHNTKRKKKPLVTDNPTGDPVRILTFDSGLDEADLVAGQIRKEVDEGRWKYRDFAVFVRMNYLTRTLESAFVKYGVPFQIVKGLAFFDRKENKDVLAYLRLLVNPYDNLSFVRAVNEPARGIGKVSLEHLQSYAEAHEIGLSAACGLVTKIPALKGKALNGLKEFHKLMTELRGLVELPPHEVIDQVLTRSGYRDMLKNSTDEDDTDRLANVEELITAAKQFHQEDPARTLGDFLEQITLASDVDGWNESEDRVSVMTLHTSKGLEFPVVYILAVENGILPHQRSLSSNDDEEVEEERRLLFVGMTRAKKLLNLCHARMRQFRGQDLYAIPSEFLRELPDESIDHVDMSRHAGRSPAHDAWRGGSSNADSAWDDTGIPAHGSIVCTTSPASVGEYFVGQIVQHDSYGIGKVSDLSGFGALRKIKIRFALHGEKTFVADKVKLKTVPKR